VFRCREHRRLIGFARSLLDVRAEFAFPGFDAQKFDIGRFAVVSGWQFFVGTGSYSFREEDWKGALKSACVAKEFMQTSPDVTTLMESDDSKQRDRAKLLMLRSQRRNLHNLCLASYMRHEAAASNQFKTQPGDWYIHTRAARCILHGTPLPAR
jgi:hypothetical protein